MKKIINVRISDVTNQQLNATEFTYFVTFPQAADYAYTIRATNEGMVRIMNIWREAGYDIHLI